MKKLLLFLFSAFAFAACEQAPIEEAHGVADSNRSLSVSFEGDDTRIQLQGGKTVWTKGDHVSVFYRSAVNEEWQFMGETGDRTGQIVPVDNSVNPPATHNRVVVIYPYNNEYYLNTETYSVEASLPAVQNYLKDSYGTNGNIMVSSNDYKQVSLKSVCGWLKLQLTGDGEVVRSITFKGNNGEQVAGELHINTSDATCVLASASGDAGDGVGGTLVRPGTILTEVTLDCGEGVTLGAEATAFYIALPPQTFENGFTVEVKCIGYKTMTISTDNSISLERNHIQPMKTVEFEAEEGSYIPNNQIWYTSSDGDVVTPYKTNVFGANIISNEYNNGMGVITFDGDVTKIGGWAFYGCESLTSVNIPDSVTTIGGYAFYECTSLTSVNIPDSVTTIGDLVFYECESLTSVNIPDSVTTIGSEVFAGCKSLREFTGKYAADGGRCLIIDNTIIAYAEASGTTYNIPESVTKIGYNAFYNCDSLTSVNIPNSVKTIGVSAFRYCTSLTSVNIPDSVTTIGNAAFKGCDSLTSVYCKATTPPALGYSDAFVTNGSGRKIYVPAGSVNAYKSANYWSEYADAIVGYDFENGEIVEVQPNNEIWYTSSDGNVVKPNNTNVFGATIISNEYNNGIGVITFDGDITTIGEWAFAYCFSLTSVNIPGSVTTIGDYVFCGCDSLTSVNIPDSVTTIGEWAFGYCDSLTSVNIPDGVTTIGYDAFAYCDSLTSVNIPDSVTEIGEYAFYKCTSLTEFTGKFAEDNGRIVVVDGSLIAFAPAGITEYTIPDSVTAIGEYAFVSCDSLTSVNIPDSVTEIGSYAFAYCDSLTSVNIPDGVTEIGYEAFAYCSSLTSVNIPDSVTTIGERAFSSCDSLKEFKGKYATEDGRSLIVDNTIIAYANASGTTYTIPDSVTSIGDYAFYYCTSLTSISIGDSVTTIGNGAFCECDSLTSVNIPDSVTSIGSSAFSNCDSLTSVTIPDSVTSIGECAFAYCYSLTSVNIPDSVTTIGNGAFAGCNLLKRVNIPDSVTTIGVGAFYGCDSLTSVYCKATTPPALGDTYVFDDNGSGRKIYVPAGSVNAYKSATNWNEYASAIVGYNFETGEVVE